MAQTNLSGKLPTQQRLTSGTGTIAATSTSKNLLVEECNK